MQDFSTVNFCFDFEFNNYEMHYAFFLLFDIYVCNIIQPLCVFM